MGRVPTAAIKMFGPADGLEIFVAATGTGPVDAVYKALEGYKHPSSPCLNISRSI